MNDNLSRSIIGEMKLVIMVEMNQTENRRELIFILGKRRSLNTNSYEGNG